MQYSACIQQVSFSVTLSIELKGVTRCSVKIYLSRSKPTTEWEILSTRPEIRPFETKLESNFLSEITI